ncbi:MAG: PorV/PorQ family protein [Candidatus Krumholzibacteriota bacterium]|nr:PorV/PorQ family protein [Candidatus Krumholzibacteriota bacterium]
MIRSLRLISVSLVLVLAFSGSLSAQGEAGASSLIIPPGARANAMGQSFVAIADDATCLWWNPAGMAFIDRMAFDLMHTQLVPDLASDVFYEYAGWVYAIKGFAVIGAAIQYLSYGDWDATGQVGEFLGTASSYEVVPTVGGAIKITNDISVGMNLKFVYVNLAPKWATQDGQAGQGSSVAVDFGGLWRIPTFSVLGYEISRLNLGLALSNLGPALTYINPGEQAAPLPRNLRVGFAYTPVMSESAGLTVVADINKSLVEYFSDNDYNRSNTYHMGAEGIYANLLVIRGGYVYDNDGDIKDMTYGIGFLFNKFRIDYASVPQASDLGRVHRWSFGMTF